MEQEPVNQTSVPLTDKEFETVIQKVFLTCVNLR